MASFGKFGRADFGGGFGALLDPFWALSRMFMELLLGTLLGMILKLSGVPSGGVGCSPGRPIFAASGASYSNENNQQLPLRSVAGAPSAGFGFQLGSELPSAPGLHETRAQTRARHTSSQRTC